MAEAGAEGVSILLVDDDEIDARGVLRALKQSRIENPVTRARDGIEALEIIRGTEGRPALAWPYLVLLDLKMPRMSGFEFLDAVRHDPKLRNMVIFVLTTSDSQEDRLDAYRQNVAGYLVKAEDGDGFVQLVRMIDQYVKCVKFPPRLG